MKKELLIAGLFSLPVVSAMSFSQASYSIVDMIKQIFSPFFEAVVGTNQFDQYFFARVLFLILIFAISLVALKQIDLFKKNKGVVFVLSAIVAILGIKFLPTDSFVSWVLIPYGAFATAMIVLLPLVVYFFFVHSAVPSSAGRKMAWILFALIFFGLWFSRIDALGGFKNLSRMAIMNWVYVGGIVLVGVLFFFDREIHRYFGVHEIGKWKDKQDSAEIAELMAERQRIRSVDNPHAKKRMEDIDKRLKELGASVGN